MVKSLSALILTLGLALVVVMAAPSRVAAQGADPRPPVGGGGGADAGDPRDNSIFGTVEEPPGVEEFNRAAGGGENSVGIFIFISNMIKIATLVAGLYVFLNLITAGYDYITAGDAKANQQVRDKLTHSILGIVIIVGSYTVIAFLSLMLFGRPDFILNPSICGPLGC